MSKKTKNILVLSWFFPPSTMPASHRTYAIAKYLNRYGYRPTIVSRKWDTYQVLHNFYKPSETRNIDYINCYHYDAYLMPYYPKLRDRFINKKGFLNIIFRKILSTFDLICFPFYIKISPYYPLYFFANELLEKNKYDGIIATGNPFEFFRIAQLLSNKHKIPYIVDYRDDWSTNKLNFNNNIIDLIKRLYFRILEKSWSKKCLFFSSVTPLYVEKIQNVIKKPGIIMYNGYFFMPNKPFQSQKFMLVYSGSLYSKQNIHILLQAVLLFISKISIDIKINFIGSSDNKNLIDTVNRYQLSNHVIITERVNALKIHEYYKDTYAFLLFPYGEIKGIVTSKIFEYLSYQKPILLCPSDNDILEEILIKTSTGLIASSVEECYSQLIKLYHHFLKNEPLIVPNKTEIEKYSRKVQIKKLAEALDKYL